MSPGSDEVRGRARRLVDAGRTWQARDVLAEHVGLERDPEALVQLGHVYYGMGDLPRAGAAWFATGTKGPEADEAVAAWREQSGDDFALMWRSLPAPFRQEPRAPRIEALRTRALTVDPELDRPTSVVRPDIAEGDDEGGMDGAQVIGWIVGALFVVCAVIGLVTVLGWLVPDA